ncbi:hypothetical protein [Stigmatella erecta]|uniref:hypothetical protein n=1 Tax=Stigmatella erecta TaxID=83460 RepID=UPI003183530E
MRLPIDEKTGKIASNSSKNMELMFFKKGIQPKEATPKKGQVNVDDFLMGQQ